VSAAFVEHRDRLDLVDAIADLAFDGSMTVSPVFLASFLNLTQWSYVVATLECITCLVESFHSRTQGFFV